MNLYLSDRSLTYYFSFKYDDKGNEIERNRHKSDWIVDCEYTYKYELDTINNWIKRIDFKNDKPQYILEREIEYY